MNVFELFLQGITTEDIKMPKLFDRNVLKIVKNFVSPRVLCMKKISKKFPIRMYTTEKLLYVSRKNKVYVSNRETLKLEKTITLFVSTEWIRGLCIFNEEIFVYNFSALRIFDMNGTKQREIECDNNISSVMVNNDGIFIGTQGKISNYNFNCNLIDEFETDVDDEIKDFCFSEVDSKFYVLMEEFPTFIVYDSNGKFIDEFTEECLFQGVFSNIFSHNNRIVCLIYEHNGSCSVKIYDKNFGTISTKKLGIISPGYTTFYLDKNSGDIYISDCDHRIFIYKGWLKDG